MTGGIAGNRARGRVVWPSHPNHVARSGWPHVPTGDKLMNSIVYIVGLVVIVLFILSFLGLR